MKVIIYTKETNVTYYSSGALMSQFQQLMLLQLQSVEQLNWRIEFDKIKKKSQINTARSVPYSESFQTSKMEHLIFVKIESGFPLTIVAESFIFNV